MSPVTQIPDPIRPVSVQEMLFPISFVSAWTVLDRLLSVVFLPQQF